MNAELKRLFEVMAEGAGLISQIVKAEYQSLKDQRAKLSAGMDFSKRQADRFGAMFDPEEVGFHSGINLRGGFLFQKFDELNRPLGEFAFGNMVVNAALNDVLSVYLAGGTPKTTWYMGLINNTSFSALAAADTISSHAGWLELGTSSGDAYSQTTRPTWTPSAPSGQAITNPTSVTFSINASVSAKGAFLVSDNTKGGTSGTLFATGAFSAIQSLASGQNLKATYTCPATAT